MIPIKTVIEAARMAQLKLVHGVLTCKDIFVQHFLNIRIRIQGQIGDKVCRWPFHRHRSYRYCWEDQKEI